MTTNMNELVDGVEQVDTANNNVDGLADNPNSSDSVQPVDKTSNTSHCNNDDNDAQQQPLDEITEQTNRVQGALDNHEFVSAPATTTKVDSNTEEPSSSESSHWDKLPLELHDMIFEHSPLTRYINGFLTVDENEIISDTIDHSTRANEHTPYTNKNARSIWLEAFDADWQGDLSKLPFSYAIDRFLTNNDLRRVKSRSMYDRLCDMYPEFTESNHGFQYLDSDIESYHTSLNPNGLFFIGELLPLLRLFNIPIYNMWMDLIQDSIRKYPNARAIDFIRYNRKDMLQSMIENGVVDINRLTCIDIDSCHMYGNHLSFTPAEFAAYHGHHDLVMSLCVYQDGRLSARVTEKLASDGNLGIIQWLHERDMCEFSWDVMDCAAKNGHLDIVQWLHESRTERCTTNAMNGAAKNGHLHVVKWLHVNRTEGCTTSAMDWAAGGGYLDIVKFLHGHRREGCTTKAMDWAASYGHLDVVKWLHENRSEGCTTDAINCAAALGNLNTVKWLHENRSEGCTTDAMDSSSINGHLHIVKWLHENRTEGCTTKAMNEAAQNGHMHIVKWLLENRSEGFSAYAFMVCKTEQIAQLLVSHLDTNQQRKFWRDLRRMKCKRGHGYSALKSSINKNRFGSKLCSVM